MPDANRAVGTGFAPMRPGRAGRGTASLKRRGACQQRNLGASEVTGFYHPCRKTAETAQKWVSVTTWMSVQATLRSRSSVSASG